jgi:(1->4)-alpha-D-glucan 1-alpha-D-glucosylmutase
MPRQLTATYRIQLTRTFTLSATRALVPYFHALGVSHLYLSPVLAARAGSVHGYDVVDHGRVNPELGSDEDLRALASDLHALGMGILLDIVPNHMSASPENRYWDDVLEHGQSSRFASWFDIDWEAPGADGKVVLPVLGDELDDVLQRGELKLHIRDSGARLTHFDHSFPLDPATLGREIQLAQLDPEGRPAADDWASGAEGKRRLAALLDAQHYQLRFWKSGAHDVNYRRFFDVNDLVALRMDSDELFDVTHRLILDWVRDGVVDGLRVDHVDGLRDPFWYLARLRDRVDAVRHEDSPQPFPLFVEKILSGDETLPAEWPVQGTTGYEFMNDVEEVFLDPDGFGAIEATYRALRRNPSLEFPAVAREGKRRVLDDGLRPDVRRVARLAHAWRPDCATDALVEAIVETIVQLEVYRTYVSEPGIVRDADRALLEAAFARARHGDRGNDSAIDVLSAAFFDPPSSADRARAELVLRFQQASGPATAKGVEDTALYSYVPLVSRNEVGGAPHRSLENAAGRLHQANVRRATDWPRALLATNTHDTKRSADVRARLAMLSHQPKEWARHIGRWRRLNRSRKQTVNGRPTPDTNAEYLFYQTLVGLWPGPRPNRRADDIPDHAWRDRARERLVAYTLKAAREAKTRTSWTATEPEYERALDAFVRGTLDATEDAPFLPDLARLTAAIAPGAYRNSLARILIQCVAPGTPDIYQGDELWNFTLVDPDNRRPVDYERRRRLLTECSAADLVRHLPEGVIHLGDDPIKLALLTTLLRFRRDHSELVQQGRYLPLSGARSGTFAFARLHAGEACMAFARTLPGPGGSAVRVSVSDELAGTWTSVLSRRSIRIDRDEVALESSVGSLINDTKLCDLFLRTG